MIFIESKLFSDYLYDYLDDEEYSELQSFLIENPGIGKLIVGTGGLRKLRWKSDNKGKRGGVRIIYYWQIPNEQIYLFTLYGKNEMSDLSANEKKALKQLLKSWVL